MLRRNNTIPVGPSRLVLVANWKRMRSHASTGGQYRSVREPVYDGWGGLREPFEGAKRQPSGACAIHKSGGRHRQTAQVGRETVGWKVADAGSKSENKEARNGFESL